MRRKSFMHVWSKRLLVAWNVLSWSSCFWGWGGGVEPQSGRTWGCIVEQAKTSPKLIPFSFVEIGYCVYVVLTEEASAQSSVNLVCFRDELCLDEARPWPGDMWWGSSYQEQPRQHITGSQKHTHKVSYFILEFSLNDVRVILFVTPQIAQVAQPVLLRWARLGQFG